MSTRFIYGLKDPWGNIFYIGKSVNVKRRVWEHCSRSLSETNHGDVGEYIKRILELGYKLESVILLECGDDWREREQEIICQYKNSPNILNISIGGDGHEGLKGNAHWRYGQKGFRGKNINDFKEKMKKITKGNNNALKRPVSQIDKISGKIIKEWDSQLLAAKSLNLNQSNISHCCAGRQRSHGGFVWKYKKSQEA